MSEKIKQHFISIKDALGLHLPLYIIIGLLFAFALWSAWLPNFVGSDVSDAHAIDFVAATNIASVRSTSKNQLLNINGSYYLMFSSSTNAGNTTHHLFMTISADGTSWSTPVQVTDNTGPLYNNSTHYNGNVAFEYNLRGGYFGLAYYDSGSQINYTTSSDALSWSATTTVSTALADNVNGDEPMIGLAFATSSDLTALVYKNAANNTLEIATSSLGSVWTNTTIDTRNLNSIWAGGVKSLEAGISGPANSQVIHAVYALSNDPSDTSHVIYASSTNGLTWTTTTLSQNDMAGTDLLRGGPMVASNMNTGGRWGVTYPINEEFVLSSPFPVTNTIIYAEQQSDYTWVTSTVATNNAYNLTGYPTYSSDLIFISDTNPLFTYIDGGLDKTAYPYIAVNTSTFTTSSISSSSFSTGSDLALAYDVCASEVGVVIVRYGDGTTGGMQFTTSSLSDPDGAPDCSVPAATATGEPADADTYVPVDVFVRRTFDTNLNPSTVTTGNVTLRANTGNTQLGAPTGANLCESVMLENDNMVACDHLSDLQPLATSTWYTFTISTGVQSAVGVSLASDITYSFQTGEFTPSSDNTPPFVQSSIPAPGSTNFPTNGNIIVEFPHAMAITGFGSVTSSANVTLETVTNGQGSGTNICASAGCTFSWDATNNLVTVNPATNFTANTQYLLTVKTTATNSNDVALIGSYMAFFETGAGADSTAPTLSFMQPASSTTDVILNTSEIVLYFSEGLDASTVNQTNVKVFNDNNADFSIDAGEQWASASSSLQYESHDNSIHIGVNGILLQNKQVCVQLTTSITDSVGVALGSTTTRCFTSINQAFVATAPTVLFADADNYNMWIEFDIPVDSTSAVTKANYNIQSPIGNQLNLANATLTYRPEARAVDISGLGLQTGQNFKATITGVQDPSLSETIANDGIGNVAQGVVLNSTDTGGFIGGFDKPDFFENTDFGDFWLKPEMCGPRTPIGNVTTTFECEFPAPAALASGSNFILTFPAGFDINYATAPASTTSYLNSDLNGHATNVPLIDTIVTNTVANTITVSTTAATIAANDQIAFELANIRTPSAPGQKQMSIVVKNESNIKQGQTINPAPFTISEGGALSISGTVCKGSTSGGSCDVAGDDTAVASAKVFLDSFGSFGDGGVMGGHMEITTDASGDFTFSGITAGQYGLGMFIDPNNSDFDGTAGGGGFMEITVTTTNFVDADFKLIDIDTAGTGQTLTVNVTGGPASEKVDVFCFAPGDYQFSAPIIKNLTLDGSGAGNTTLTLNQNTNYECSMGPHIPFESFSSGGPPPIPDFTFMPPQPQVVNVLEANLSITFALETAGSQIIGKVVDGSGSGIANVFVDAFPPFGGIDDSGSHKEMNGSFTQTKSDGTFTLNVINGTYEVGSCAPGMPCTPPIEVTVKDDTSNVGTDSNSTADVYSDGTLLTGVGLTLAMAKSGVTIAGQLQDENGNVIKYGGVEGILVASSPTPTCDSFVPNGSHVFSPTDSSGNYTLYVSNGTWRVSGFAPSYGEVGCSIITVSGGTSLSSQNIKATAADYGTISGTVTKNSTAVGGAFVNCYGPNGGNQKVSGSDGAYSMKVKAGTYSCHAFLPGAGDFPEATGVVVASEGTATEDFTMGNPGTITVNLGSVTDAFCDARDSNGKGNGTGQNSSGVYSINVPAGTYTVKCGNPSIGGGLSGTATVTAGATTAVTLTPPTLYTVTGRVTDGTNNLSGASVTFMNIDTGIVVSQQSDGTTGSDANVSASLQAGTYEVVASKSNYVDDSTTETITVSANTTFTTRALTKAAASLAITVRDSSDNNYSGNAKIVATKSDGKVAVADSDISVTSGANATMYLTNGTWSLVAYGDNGKQSSALSVVVTADTPVPSAANMDLDTAISGFTYKEPKQQSVTLTSGGVFKDSNIGDNFEVNIPSNALSTSDSTAGTVETSYDPTSAIDTPGKDFLGEAAISITPKTSSGKEIKNLATSGQTATVKIPYDESDVPTGVDEEDVKCGIWSESAGDWEIVPTTVDTTNNTLTCQWSHFSIGGAVASTGGGATASPSTGSSDSSSSSGGVLGVSPPTVNSFVINGDEEETDSLEVDLSFDVENAELMVISNSSDFAKSSFEDYMSTTTWTLTEGNGTKRVYVRFRSEEGGQVTVSDTIVLTGQEFDQSAEEEASAIEEDVKATCALPVGKAYKYEGSPGVYYITEDCTKRPFKSASKFFTYFDSWDDVNLVEKSTLDAMTDDTLGFMPWGPNYDPKYGALVKIVKDPKVYLLLGADKHWITSEVVFTGLKYVWNWIEDVAESLLDKYNSAGEIDYTDHHPNHTIIKYEDSSKIYKLEPNPENEDSQVKRHVKDMEAFDSLGFREDRIVEIDDEEVYDDGEVLEVSADDENQAKVLGTKIINLENNLTVGDQGEEVQVLQQKLRELGYFDYPQNTGIYGTITVEAVRAFQSDHGLSSVGVVGPETRALLNSL